jgi:hypothetical protein
MLQRTIAVFGLAKSCSFLGPCDELGQLGVIVCALYNQIAQFVQSSISKSATCVNFIFGFAIFLFC